MFARKVSFVSPDTGWFISGQNPGQLFKSTNGGSNWFIQYTAPDDLRNLYFINSQTGFIVGPFGGFSVRKTTNGGNNWIPTINSEGGTAIAFANENTSWISNGFFIMQKSTDGGITWNDQSSPIFNIVCLSVYDTSLSGEVEVVL